MRTELTQYLARKLSGYEKQAINAELTKLFTLHDKPVKPLQVEMILLEIEKMNVLPKYVLEGIRSLADCDIPKISWGVIKNAIVSKNKESIERVNCACCNGTGYVSLVDCGRSFAFACNCAKGNSIAASSKINQWNGKDRQFICGREYIRHELYLMGDKQYREWLKIGYAS